MLENSMQRLLHACCAIDATAKRLYPNSTRIGVRYVNCLRRYYWLLEPMMGAGINLIETRFANVPLPKTPTPDFAEVIYHIFRCGHAHGDEIPAAFSVLPSGDDFYTRWEMANGELHIPDRVIWALLSVGVLSEVNRNETTPGDYYLSLGGERFPVREWWGRENDFRPVAERNNKVRVKMDCLDRLPPRHEGDVPHVEKVLILNPPFI